MRVVGCPLLVVGWCCVMLLLVAIDVVPTLVLVACTFGLYCLLLVIVFDMYRGLLYIVGYCWSFVVMCCLLSVLCPWLLLFL